MIDSKRYVLYYPSVSRIPNLVPVKESILKTCKELCRGFEIVYAKNLSHLDAVFICSDLFREEDLPNLVGTFLYGFDNNYLIRGDICICRNDGEELSGYSQEDAFYIRDQIEKMLIPLRKGGK